MTKAGLWQFLTRCTINAHCAICAIIPYAGFSRRRSHIVFDAPWTFLELTGPHSVHRIYVKLQSLLTVYLPDQNTWSAFSWPILMQVTCWLIMWFLMWLTLNCSKSLSLCVCTSTIPCVGEYICTCAFVLSWKQLSWKQQTTYIT